MVYTIPGECFQPETESASLVGIASHIRFMFQVNSTHPVWIELNEDHF